METVTIGRKDIIELAKLASELEDRLESLELMSDPEVMAFYPNNLVKK